MQQWKSVTNASCAFGIRNEVAITFTAVCTHLVHAPTVDAHPSHGTFIDIWRQINMDDTLELSSIWPITKDTDNTVNQLKLEVMDLFVDTAAILNSVVSNSYYGMLRGQISVFDM